MNTFSKLGESLIINAINLGHSYRSILSILNCHQNSNNIKLLKKFMSDNNIVKDFDNISFIEKENIQCVCVYCNNFYNVNGIKYHQIYCKMNPNRKTSKGNNGKTKGYTAWNKGLTTKNNEIVKKIAITLHNKYASEEIVSPLKGKHHTEDAKCKIRESTIKYLKQNKGFKHPRYNINSGKYIQKLNEEKSWNLQYYNNGGEILVDGYFLDGYDKDLNIVFEYDEPNHYKDVYNNILKEKDIIRQNNIINKLHCEFWRYNERLDLLYRVN